MKKCPNYHGEVNAHGFGFPNEPDTKTPRRLKSALALLRGIVVSGNVQVNYDRDQTGVEVPKEDIRQIERFLKRIG